MKLNKFSVVLTAFVLLAGTGCKHDDVNVQHYDNKLFLKTSKFTEELLLKGAVESLSRQISVGIAKPVANEISVELAAAPELLDNYRASYYDQDVQLLDAAHYELSQSTLLIEAGAVESGPASVDFLALDQLDKELRYVLPVTIRSVEGISGVLGSARTFYFLFRGAALINVVADISENRAWPDWKDASPVTDMTTFTLEAMIYGNAFKNQIATIMGIEGKFLVRIGDNGVPSNQIQVASGNNITSSELKLDVGRWYHVAVTFDQGNVIVYLDGKKSLEGNVGTESVNFGVKHTNEDDGQERCFWIGYSYNHDRYLNGMISEVRIWNRVLTAEQVNSLDHFYTVEPDAEGLVAYWKFDDGAGVTVKDHTSFGNDLTVGKAPKWIGVALPENK